MATGGGDFETALDGLLPFDVGKVVLVVAEGACELGAGVDHGRLDGGGPVEEVDDLSEAFGAVDLQIVHDGGLAGVGAGYDDALALLAPGLDGDGEDPFDGPQTAVQTQLAHDDIAVEVVTFHHADGAEDADGDGEVVGGAFLLEVGGCEVDDEVLVRDLESGLEESR